MLCCFECHDGFLGFIAFEKHSAFEIVGQCQLALVTILREAVYAAVKQRVVGLLDSIVRLVPGSIVLGNVDVLPFDKRLDAIIKAAMERMDANEDAASNFFYRQTTRLDGNTTSMVEAFFHAKSAFSLRDLMLITGRYSEDEAKDGIFGHSANLFVLSELSMVCKTRSLRGEGFVSPLYRSYARYYDVSHDVIDEGRRTVYAIHFKPKGEHRRRMMFDGTIYVAPDGNEILKAEGRVTRISTRKK